MNEEYREYARWLHSRGISVSELCKTFNVSAPVMRKALAQVEKPKISKARGECVA